MAEKRMFSQKIIDSDNFLDMPLSTQSVYFHLAMRADDEGFINNPKKILRMIGGNEDEIRLLIAKKFVLDLDTGVVIIKHWHIHNHIRKDRTKLTSHTKEKSQLSQKENGSYTINQPTCNQLATNLQPNVGIDKTRLEEISNTATSCEVAGGIFEAIWKQYSLQFLGKEQNRRGGDKQKAKKGFINLYGKYSVQDIKALVVNEYKIDYNRDLQRVFTLNSMKQFIEDRGKA